jgi:hypothetical protein
VALCGAFLFGTFSAATALVLYGPREQCAMASAGEPHWRVIRVVHPERPVPTGMVRPEPVPRIEGSLVVEDVGAKPRTELVPALLEPPF